MMKLHHGGPKPDTLKLEIALAEAGTEPDRILVDPEKLQQWAPEHRVLAPQGQLPVLEDGDLVMADSGFALQYLGEAYAPALVSNDPWEWYEVQAIMQRIDAGIGPNVNLIGWHQTGTAESRAAYRAALAQVEGRETNAGWDAVWADAEATEDAIANAEKRIGAALDELAARLTHADWLVGGRYSILDINAYALVRAVEAVRPALIAARPALRPWLERIAARPALAAFKQSTVAFAPPN